MVRVRLPSSPGRSKAITVKLFKYAVLPITALTLAVMTITSINTEIDGLKQDTQHTKETLDSIHDMIENLQKDAEKIQKDVEKMQKKITVHPKVLLKSFIKTMKGNGWKAVDLDNTSNSGDSSSNSNPHKFSCDMYPFMSTKYGATGHKMCVHPFKDILSDSIRGHGRWGECSALADFWNNEAQDSDSDSNSNSNSSKPQAPIYVEVGANIGACVMEMLFNTDAPIVAFEPNPKNLYALTETLRGLPKKYRDRVVLFPLALGSSRGSNTIYGASDNLGNSVVGKVVKDYAVQTFSKENQFEIQIERLDDLLNGGFNVPLIKLDAQGFECEILKGMGKELASSVDHIHFEKEDIFLKPQGCNDLLARFRDYGFTIYHGNRIITPEQDHRLGTLNLDARRVKTSN